MNNEYELISFGISVDICRNEKETITNCIAELYKGTYATKGRLHDLRLYCNKKLIISFPDLDIEEYTNQVDTIYNTIATREMEHSKNTKVQEKSEIDPFLTLLKYIKTEIDSNGSRRLELNYNWIKYDYNSNIFILSKDNKTLALSKPIDHYKYLETYKDVYVMLLDLGLDYRLLNEIFIVNGSEKIDSLHEIRLYAKRTQESLRRGKSDFSSPEDVEFLGELRDNPIGYAIKQVKEQFEETLNNLNKIGTVGFFQGDTTKVSHYKDLTYDEQMATIVIELSAEIPVTGMNIF